jgi:hypothetical protein
VSSISTRRPGRAAHGLDGGEALAAAALRARRGGRDGQLRQAGVGRDEHEVADHAGARVHPAVERGVQLRRVLDVERRGAGGERLAAADLAPRHAHDAVEGGLERDEALHELAAGELGGRVAGQQLQGLQREQVPEQACGGREVGALARWRALRQERLLQLARALVVGQQPQARAVPARGLAGDDDRAEHGVGALEVAVEGDDAALVGRVGEREQLAQGVAGQRGEHEVATVEGVDVDPPDAGLGQRVGRRHTPRLAADDRHPGALELREPLRGVHEPPQPGCLRVPARRVGVRRRLDDAALLQRAQELPDAVRGVLGQRRAHLPGRARAVEQRQQARDDGPEVGAGQLDGAEVRPHDGPALGLRDRCGRTQAQACYAQGPQPPPQGGWCAWPQGGNALAPHGGHGAHGACWMHGT